jgi:hypothetical protein
MQQNSLYSFLIFNFGKHFSVLVSVYMNKIIITLVHRLRARQTNKQEGGLYEQLLDFQKEE